MWGDIVEHRGVGTTLGIDTALARELEDELEDHGVPDFLFSTTEGDWSMFVDAVNRTASSSSYGPRKTLDFSDPSRLKEIFSRIDVVGSFERNHIDSNDGC